MTVIAPALPLAGGTAWVTGAASGIGRAVALQFASAKASVLIIDRDRDASASVVEEARAAGAPAAAAALCDLADAGSVAAAFAALDDPFSCPDMLVNCAGVSERYPADSFPEHAWQRILDTNRGAAFRLSQRAVRGMIERGVGRIVNLSSIAGAAGYPGTIGYLASKGGLEQLTRGLAAEWGPKGITVNAVAPGPVATPLFEAMRREDPARAERMLARAPIAEPAQPEEVAAAVLFLCSRAARMINGHILALDGGYRAT